MKLFVIIATVVACACAAPTVELQHPSPVNPSVLVELKPEEKIILITDPKEIAKFKRETKQPLYPTVLPGEHVHHITKRDHKPGHDAKAPKTPKSPTVAQKPLQKPQVPKKPSLTKRNRRNVESHQKPELVKVEEFQKPQLLPAFLPAEVISQETLESTKTDDNKETHQDTEDVKNVTSEVYQKPQGLPAIFSPSNKATQQQKRDIPVPLVAKHHHPEESPKETTEKEVNEEKPKHETEVFQKPQGLPAIFSPSNDAPQPQKRDIPVPLVPKHHHPEESPKDIDEKETHEDKKEVSSENLPAHIQDHVTVEGFEKPQTLPFILKETLEENQQHKRDIPVPLVPKHQHPEESPKEVDEKETHEDKNEVHSENHHEHQTLQAHIQDHVTVEGFEKPQTVPFTFQKTPTDTQQQKRDIPVPLVPKQQHSEESPKESNEKESHEDKKEVNTEYHHEHQTLQAHIQDHVTIPIFFKEYPEDNQQHKRDIPVPLVPKHQHSEESPKESNEKDSHEQKKEDNTENHHEPQTLSSYNQQHILIEGKPQTLPLKDTPEDAQQQKIDIPVALVAKHHHPEESQKENNGKVDQEDKNEFNTENHHVCQTLPAHNHDHVTIVEIQKPQTLPLIVKETVEDTQQHKRDIPVPLVPKHHHPEESPKASNENESHKDKKEENSENHQVPQTLQIKDPQFSPNIENVKSDDTQQQKRDILVHKEESVKDNSNEKELHEQRKEEKSENHHVPHISQTLPTNNHEHLNIQGIHKPQVLPTFNHDHISQSSFEKSEISSNHQEHKNNEKGEGDIQIHHISQTLPGHIHKHLAMEGLQKPQIQPGHNQEHTGFHKPQTLPTHHYEHIHSEGVQKPQTTPDLLKESTDDTYHQGTHVSGPVVDQHQVETQNENRKNVKKSTEYDPNLHEVQVEDLSDSKPYQQSIHHALPIQGDHKPNIRDDHLSAPDFKTSTTDHPVLRHRPVPVAELFARAHDN